MNSALDIDTLIASATQFTFFPTGEPEEALAIKVERCDYTEDSWAIRWNLRCLNNKGEWEGEPFPSNRNNAFLKRCRFSLDEAIERAAAIQGHPGYMPHKG